MSLMKTPVECFTVDLEGHFSWFTLVWPFWIHFPSVHTSRTASRTRVMRLWGHVILHVRLNQTRGDLQPCNSLHLYDCTEGTFNTAVTSDSWERALEHNISMILNENRYLLLVLMWGIDFYGVLRQIPNNALSHLRQCVAWKLTWYYSSQPPLQQEHHQSVEIKSLWTMTLSKTDFYTVTESCRITWVEEKGDWGWGG